MITVHGATSTEDSIWQSPDIRKENIPPIFSARIFPKFANNIITENYRGDCMRRTQSPILLRQHPSQMTVILTDLCEPELLVKELAEEARKAAPKDFAGEAPCVFFKLQYTAPCESFTELRRLILEVRSKTGLRANYKGIVAIDMSEWINHEREIFFSIVLKYLYDHRAIWQPVMLLRDCSIGQVQHFLRSCALYLTPKVVDQNIFTNDERLEFRVMECFSKKGYTLRREARKLLVEQLRSDRYAKARSLTLLERVADELVMGFEGKKEITESQVRKYFQNPYTALAMLTGESILPRKAKDDENEKLYL